MAEKKNEKSYEQLFSELESILEKVQSGEVDSLDSLIKDFERGEELASELQKMLSSAKAKIDKINSTKG